MFETNMKQGLAEFPQDVIGFYTTKLLFSEAA